MATRAVVHQVVQVGSEVTAGTAVPANRRLLGTSIEPAIKADIASVRPLGGKFATAAALGKEWVEASISGQASYNDLAYLLASALVRVTPVQQGGTIAYLWTFSPAHAGPDTVATFTVEAGSAVRAGRFAYGLVTGLTLTADRSKVEISGDMVGRAYQDAVTMTASPTDIAQVPILPVQISVFADPTSGALGTTKLLRVLSAELAIGDRYGTLWTLDAAQGAWLAHVETPPTVTFKVMVEADAQGMGMLTAMRDGSKRFLRLEAVGALIAGAFNYRLRVDMCGVVTGVSDFSDQDGVYAIEWTFQGVFDSAWNAAIQVALTNIVTAL